MNLGQLIGPDWHERLAARSVLVPPTVEPSPEEIQAANARKRHPRRLLAGDRGVVLRALASLRRVQVRTQELAEMCSLPVSNVMHALSYPRELGIVRRQYTPRRECLWALTESGRRAIEHEELRLAMARAR